jgi:ribonuclease HII
MAMKYFLEKNRLEAGCDEAGRGCLAGPVFAAAVILPERVRFPELNDSKQLNAATRDKLRISIEKKALAWAVAMVDHDGIEQMNILWAAIHAMHLAIDKLEHRPAVLLIDGNRFKPYRDLPYQCVIGGDGIYASIAAASILAKTHRDEYMQDLHNEFPHYGWNVNKGYGTKLHRDGIRQYGLTPYHRKGFNMGIEPEAELFKGRTC